MEESFGKPTWLFWVRGWCNGFLCFARTFQNCCLSLNYISHDARQKLWLKWTHGGFQCTLGNVVL